MAAFLHRGCIHVSLVCLTRVGYGTPVLKDTIAKCTVGRCFFFQVLLALTSARALLLLLRLSLIMSIRLILGCTLLYIKSRTSINVRLEA